MNDRISQLAQQWGERFEAFSLRERALISAGLLVVMFLLWDSLLMNPEHVRQTRMVGAMHELNAGMADVNGQIETLLIATQDSEAPHLQTRIQAIETLLSDLERQKKSLTVEFVPPERMATLLRDMLGGEHDLTLISLRSLGAEPLFKEKDTEEKTGANTPDAVAPPLTTSLADVTERQTEREHLKPGIFKHGVRVEFEGNFLATLRYLQALENMPWRFYWDSVDYQVLEYPVARVAITVHTLSLDRGWIGV
ncbi:MAG: hypothetical protein GXP17_10380 [Gammaproteobacteria bacterium]|nr:hypothetical protein [Gammaproteobacteria bacterium]